MKDFLVLCDGSAEDAPRFACVESLASKFDGCINVVVASELPPLPISAGDAAVYVPFDDERRDVALARGAEIKATVEQRFQSLSRPVTVFRVDESFEFIGRAVAALARTHDLFVTTLPNDSGVSKLNSAILDRVLIEGGRGILGLPSKINTKTLFDHVSIAWNGSRECARAVSQAMPFITRAREVTVVLVDPQLRQAGAQDRPGDSIVNHLRCYDIHATLSRVTAGEMNTSEAILAEVTRVGSDLLVLGAQAEGGILRWFQGSTSREVFASTAVPLLLAY